jgi:hypothetical protein
MNANFRQAFPNLEKEGWQQTSAASEKYNCIAWAAGQQAQWWWPYHHPVYYWPEGVPRELSVDRFVQAFASVGLEPCEHEDLEPGFEKVAIFAIDRKPTHAARQLPDGQWTSKLGKNIDITHSLRGLEGPVYGQVAGYLKRPRAKD